MSASDLSLRAEGMNSVFEDVENTVVNNWWFSEVPNLIKSEQKLHTETRKRLEDYAVQKEAELKMLTERVKTGGKGLKDNLMSKQVELSSVRDRADELLRRREKLSENLLQMKGQNRELAERLEMRKKESTIEQEELRKGSSYFQERLGLKLNKVKGGWMEVVFTQICKVDPARPFFFTCRVNESKIYEVGDCDPPIKDFELLVSKLNETNNLRSFIIEMRRRFKDHAESHQLSS